MIVVSDTSALANLALVDQLWLLEALYQCVIVPDVVATELAAASNLTISAILQLGWIQAQSLKPPSSTCRRCLNQPSWFSG